MERTERLEHVEHALALAQGGLHELHELRLRPGQELHLVAHDFEIPGQSLHRFPRCIAHLTRPPASTVVSLALMVNGRLHRRNDDQATAEREKRRKAYAVTASPGTHQRSGFAPPRRNCDVPLGRGRSGLCSRLGRKKTRKMTRQLSEVK